MINPSARAKLVAAGTVLLALMLVPAPLLPPHRLAEAMEALLGVSWQVAYFATALGLRICFYVSLGVVAAFTVKRAARLRGLWLQIVVVPMFVIGAGLLIRSVKAGYMPVGIDIAIGIAGCLVGVALGLALVYRAGKITMPVLVAIIALSLWGLLGGTSAALSRATEAHLQRLEAAAPGLPSGEARFGAILQTAFAPMPGGSAHGSAVEQNRAAILALGVALGDEELARFVGLEQNERLLRATALIRDGVMLREDPDLSRHFCLSAAFVVMGGPLVSDAAGLMKERMDFMKAGSGFSFNDIAADRAGVRFAVAATGSEAGARAMQARLQRGFAVDDFMPPVADLPEHLSVDQFLRDFGHVGSPRYREQVKEIEARLDRCGALSPHPSGG